MGAEDFCRIGNFFGGQISPAGHGTPKMGELLRRVKRERLTSSSSVVGQSDRQWGGAALFLPKVDNQPPPPVGRKSGTFPGQVYG